MSVTAYAFPFAWNKAPFYVDALPGKDGSDWSYTPNASQAIVLSPYWWARFAADQRRLGRAAFATPA